VTLEVQQDGDYRDFIWTAAWLDSAVSGEMNMGRMVCPLSDSERSHLEAVPKEELQRMVVPCNIRNPDQLVAGSEIVRQIVVSVAALRPKRVAMVGLGPGTMATYWQRYHPQIERIDVAEMSGTVVDIAKRYFGLRPDWRLRVHVAEGMDWLQGAEPFDVFVHDATGSQHYFLWPSSLRLIREKSNGGTMVINTLGTPGLVKALLLTYMRMQFAEVRTFAHVAVASWSPIDMSLDGLPEHVRAWQEQDTWDLYCSDYLVMLVLMAVLVTAAVMATLAFRAKRPKQCDEEQLAPIARLHPRAAFRVRSGLKERDAALLAARSKLAYSML